MGSIHKSSAAYSTTLDGPASSTHFLSPMKIIQGLDIDLFVSTMFKTPRVQTYTLIFHWKQV